MKLWVCVLFALAGAADVCLFQYNTPYCGWLVQNETYTCGVCRNFSVWDPAPTTLWPVNGVTVDCYSVAYLYADPNCTGSTTSTLGSFPFASCQTINDVSWQFNNCSNSEIGQYCLEQFSSTGGTCAPSTSNTTYNCTDSCIADGGGSLAISCNGNSITSYLSPGCTGPNSTVLGQFDSCFVGATNDFRVKFGPCEVAPVPVAPLCLFRYTGPNCITLDTTTGINNGTCNNASVAATINSVFPTTGFYTLFANSSCAAPITIYLYDTCYSFVSSSWILSSANCSAPIPPIITPTPPPTPTPITPPAPTVCLYLYSDLSCNFPSTWFNITCLGFCTASPAIPVSAAHSCVTNTTILYQNTSCLSSPWASAVNGACQFYSTLFGTSSMKPIEGVCPPLPVITPTPTPTPPGLFCSRFWSSLNCGGNLVNSTTGTCQQCAFGNFLPNCGTGNVTNFLTSGCTGSVLAVGAFSTCIPTGSGSSVIFYSGSCPALPSPAPVPAPAPNTCARFWTPSLVCGGTQIQDPVQNYCWNSSSPGLAVNFFASSPFNSFRFNCNTQLISFFSDPFCSIGSTTSSFLIGNCFSFGSSALQFSTSNTSCNLCSGVYFFFNSKGGEGEIGLRKTKKFILFIF